MVRTLEKVSLLLVGITLGAFYTLSSAKIMAATESVDDIYITVPAACTLVGEEDENDPHEDSFLNNSYNTEIGTTNMAAYCNDDDGFAIYAIGYSNDEYGNTEMISSVPATGNISTGVYSAGSTTNSLWSMKLTAVSGAYTPVIVGSSSDSEKIPSTPNFSSYVAVPDIYTKVAYRNSGTDVTYSGYTPVGANLTTTYAVYVSPTQGAATYTGQVRYTLIHPNNSSESTLKIMQDVASWKNSLSTGQEISAIDTRDNKIYKVAKLADGNIWMTQNLDFDIDSTVTYTNEDTDIGWNTSTNSYGTASWTPSLSTYPTGSNSWEIYSWYSPDSYDPGDYCWSGVIDDGTMAYCSQYGSHYHLGNYYTWTAAIAMNSSSSYTTFGTNVNQSICPKGWTLPKSGTSDTGSGSFHYLLSQYNTTSIWESPMYFVFGGQWYGQFESQNVSNVKHSVVGWKGFYHSSTTGRQMQGRMLANGLTLDGNGTIQPQATIVDRRDGFSIRCIAR